VRYGVHLPIMGWDGTRFEIGRLAAVARRAEELGFDTLSVNDHLVFGRAWLDGPTALAAVIASAPTLRLTTSVVLPVVRGPVALAKALAAIDRLSGGRLVAGLGPGSTALDYEAVGIPFEERWARFDEAVRAMRALLDPAAEPFAGRFYDTRGVELAPTPVRTGGPAIWIGSWGSSAGLRRVARLADGWVASAYNTAPPERFAAARRELADHLRAAKRDPHGFPNTLATMRFHLTDDENERTHVLRRLALLLGRDSTELEGLLPIGPPGLCADLVARYHEAGVERILFWPLTDEVRQLDRLAEALAQVEAGPTTSAAAEPEYQPLRHAEVDDPAR
jgi:alkanesulfonate monooxygenase SsuD/methylene tetrahydromethanopterin reductase-like flavin-dependent oxidoreductase (luciferase family)